MRQRAATWKNTLAMTVPATYIAFQQLEDLQFYVAMPIMYLPTLYYMYDAYVVRRRMLGEIKRMWLFRNGD